MRCGGGQRLHDAETLPIRLTRFNLMNTSSYSLCIALYASARPVFVAMDRVWPGFAARNIYRNQIGFLMASEINWTVAIIYP